MRRMLLRVLALTMIGTPVFADTGMRHFEIQTQAAGSGLNEVAKVTVYLASADDFPTLNELYAEFFPQNPPARATPIVQLPKGLLISIEAVAAAPYEPNARPRSR